MEEVVLRQNTEPPPILYFPFFPDSFLLLAGLRPGKTGEGLSWDLGRDVVVVGRVLGNSSSGGD